MTELSRPEFTAPTGWPRVGKVRFVDVPERRCLMIDGVGAPGGPEFQDAIGAIFGTAYTLKFALKHEGIQTRVGYLEALWRRTGEQSDVPVTQVIDDPSALAWTIFMELPEAAGDADIAAAIESNFIRHPSTAMGRLRVERWREGRAVEAMHVGPYEAETETIARMLEAAAVAGVHPTGPHHEIYISDPNRTAPEKLRTVLRQPLG